MSELWNSIEMVFYNIIHEPRWNDILDIIIMAVLLYYLILFARHTRTVQVVKGLAILIAGNYISSLMGLTSLSWLLQTVLNNGFVLLIVLFQPQLRRVLERLGRGAHVAHGGRTQDEESRIVDEITTCLIDLSKRRVGALIVFEQNTGLKEFLSTGVRVDADITAALLENIFEPNTPLHDGAVIISEGRVHTAACVLPLTESTSIPQELGTRHRAAIGISEQTDARVLVVSEETGKISATFGGEIRRPLNERQIREILNGIFGRNKTTFADRVKKLFSGVEEEENRS